MFCQLSVKTVFKKREKKEALFLFKIKTMCKNVLFLDYNWTKFGNKLLYQALHTIVSAFYYCFFFSLYLIKL